MSRSGRVRTLFKRDDESIGEGPDPVKRDDESIGEGPDPVKRDDESIGGGKWGVRALHTS